MKMTTTETRYSLFIIGGPRSNTGRREWTGLHVVRCGGGAVRGRRWSWWLWRKVLIVTRHRCVGL